MDVALTKGLAGNWDCWEDKLYVEIRHPGRGSQSFRRLNDGLLPPKLISSLVVALLPSWLENHPSSTIRRGGDVLICLTDYKLGGKRGFASPSALEPRCVFLWWYWRTSRTLVVVSLHKSSFDFSRHGASWSNHCSDRKRTRRSWENGTTYAR